MTAPRFRHPADGEWREERPGASAPPTSPIVTLRVARIAVEEIGWE